MPLENGIMVTLRLLNTIKSKKKKSYGTMYRL